MRSLHRAVFLLFIGLMSLVDSVMAQGIAIDHQAVGCVIAERFPRYEARLTPSEKVGRARLHFKPEGGLHWYSVAMKREGEAFEGVLPQPTKSLKAFTYYIEVTATDLGTSRTPEFTSVVGSGPVACKDKVVAGALASSAVNVAAPSGAPAIPPGFASTGVVTAGSTTGPAAVTGGAGGGMSGTTIAILGVAAAGGAAGIAVAAGGGGSGASTQAPPSQTRTFASATTVLVPWQPISQIIQTSPIQVTGLQGTITSVTVMVDIRADPPGNTCQLILDLKHPDGTQLELADRASGCGTSSTWRTIFPTESAPTVPLTALNGKSPNGTWGLVLDNEGSVSPSTRRDLYIYPWSLELTVR